MRTIFINILILFSACSRMQGNRSFDGSRKYFPKIGDHIGTVYSHILTPYFSSQGPNNGEIHGYLYDTISGEFSGFGPGMLPEGEKRIKVILLFTKNDIVSDLIQLDGVITDEMLNGEAGKHFIQKWDDEKNNP